MTSENVPVPESAGQYTCPKCHAELDLAGVSPGARFTCQSCQGVFQLAPEDGAPPLVAGSDRGCLTCMIPIAVLIGSFLVGMIVAWPSVQRRIERGFVEVLRTQASSQDAYRAEPVRDDDGDGKGEYVFVADMPYLDGPLDEGEAPIGLPAELKAKVVKAEGVVNLGAYSLIFYLPRADGTWERDSGRDSVENQEHADVRESAFIAYAVPNRPGWLGSRAFVVDQGVRQDGGTSTHQIWYCENTGESGGEPYSAENLPAAAAAYPTPRAALDSPLGSVTDPSPTDGRVWRRVEERAPK